MIATRTIRSVSARRNVETILSVNETIARMARFSEIFAILQSQSMQYPEYFADLEEFIEIVKASDFIPDPIALELPLIPFFQSILARGSPELLNYSLKIICLLINRSSILLQSFIKTDPAPNLVLIFHAPEIPVGI
jgi:hypothetical protein